MSSMEHAGKLLMSFGLTEIESRVYLQLLRQNPATGYQVAQAIGKPAANVYNALKNLEMKSAALLQDESRKQYSPVPVRNFFQFQERNFKIRKNQIEALLSGFENNKEDEKVYSIKSVEQVLDRCHAMFSSARKVILIDAFPAIVDALVLRDEFNKKPKADVYLKAYTHVTLDHVQVSVDARGDAVLHDYPGQWLKVSIDGAEFLLAFLAKDLSQVYQAIWSQSNFLSLIVYQGIWSEMLLDQRGKNSEHNAWEGPEGYKPSHKYSLPGYIKLLDQFGEAKIKGKRQ